jgi:hypothetical protein
VQRQECIKFESGCAIFLRKRDVMKVAYVSLVGATLEVDQPTLHRPEYCKILLGCKNIHELPESAGAR